ncbi:acyl-CoA dehydrogenase [SAR92 clade bacterium H455]|uniref:Acyl-CoA dehydrogenase n=1 Tax=SAR92 clade bacterium H455 TaxID=2974818 RepID=A0ABY5TJ28_9GAMM|nr:acyl-CoA dehydrogenase [SAR92 clade bacterium H455]
MSVYKVPQKELAFIFDEIINYSEICSMPGFEDASRDMVDVVLPEAAKFFEDVVAPTNHETDKHPAFLKDGEVVTSPGLDPIYRQMVDAGWCCLNGDSDYGGAGFPSVVDLAVQEMLQTANCGFSLLPMLSRGVVHALNQYGSDEQKETYLGNLISGAWSGTMNLTEPQAGSDLSAVKTKAVLNGDHYLISGQKIYITWGDHSCADNIIHLVLARRPDAPEGNQGISLFLVPKFLVNADGSLGERNDVKPVGVEHKLGIHSSPTCTLAFGDNGGAVGYLVGEENKGLQCMFTMMNNARLSVGHQGVSLGERAYQQAVAYATDRVQGRASGVEGRAAIIHHPDVKRMLMQMRALTEGGRAMSYYAIAAEDRSSHHPDEEVRAQSAQMVELLTPLVKGWCTEVAMESTSLGVQVHGGMGFIEETGAAQHMRDARILPIYEGTNGIQALDFIGRKCLRDGGAVVKVLLADMQATVDQLAAAHGSVVNLRNRLRHSIEQCQEALNYVLENSSDSQGIAYNFMMIYGNTVSYWLLVKLAAAAQDRLAAGATDRFYNQKIATAEFFSTQILPRNSGYLATLILGADSFDALEPADFLQA